MTVRIIFLDCHICSTPHEIQDEEKSWTRVLACFPEGTLAKVLASDLVMGVWNVICLLEVYATRKEGAFDDRMFRLVERGL